MIIDVTNTLVVDERVRQWCVFPYPDHPKGCPNYNSKACCPSIVPMIDYWYNLDKPHWFAIYKFDLDAHVQAMSKKHPKWSYRQCRCCLYWQNGVRKYLKGMCENEIMFKPELSYTLIPEALGVNVFRTVHRHGIKMRKAAFPIIYKVALIAHVKN